MVLFLSKQKTQICVRLTWTGSSQLCHFKQVEPALNARCKTANLVQRLSPVHVDEHRAAAACGDVQNSLQPRRSLTLAALTSKQHAWQLAGVPTRPKNFVTVDSVAFQLTGQHHSWITGLAAIQTKTALGHIPAPQILASQSQTQGLSWLPPSVALLAKHTHNSRYITPQGTLWTTLSAPLACLLL